VITTEEIQEVEILCLIYPVLAINRKAVGSIPDEVNFYIYLILGPGVYSASNRNEYQKHKNNNDSGK
jgi:hypothetical protein